MNNHQRVQRRRATYRNRFLYLSALIVLAIIPLLSSAQTRVIGYMAGFNDMTATVDTTDLSKLTHINLSFTNPNSSGVMVANDVLVCMPNATNGHVTGTELRYVIDKAQAAGVKVLASVAGGVIPECSGNWETLLQPENRPALVENLVKFVEDFNLDGLDVDLEGVLLTNIDNAGNYTPFIQELSVALKSKNKLLTCATASYVGGMIPTSSIQYFDFVNIMSYDAIGPSWGTPGIEHSSYAQAQEHINIWKDRGLTKDKLVLGVPFYGYGFGTYNSDYNFKNIISEFGMNAGSEDLIGTACAGCNYITYNGIPTIRAKTQLALQEGSGVMIWELSQDATGANSLLNVIDQEIKSSGSSSSSSSSVASSSVGSNSSSEKSGSGSGNMPLMYLLGLLILSVARIRRFTAYCGGK